ncbi:MAG: hypothetical protein N3G76_02720 [Candidatus Micrarchaeota archaeon]|nr:hypothetical protein [Candidatus Micrarchaeota archaeon]
MLMGMGHMRGQVAIEFLAVVAFFMLISVPLFMYFYTAAPQKEYYASLSQAESAADELIKYGELVGTQGNGTTVSRVIVFPKHATRVSFNSSHVSIHIEYSDLKTDIVRAGPVNFIDSTYSLPAGGSYSFTFKNTNGNVYVTKG